VVRTVRGRHSAQVARRKCCRGYAARFLGLDATQLTAILVHFERFFLLRPGTFSAGHAPAIALSLSPIAANVTIPNRAVRASRVAAAGLPSFEH